MKSAIDGLCRHFGSRRGADARNAERACKLGSDCSRREAFLSSDWVVTEFSAALSVKVRIGEIDNPFRLAALAKFHRLITAALEIVPVRREHFRTAARFADHYSVGSRAGDALHLAPAADRSATISHPGPATRCAASALRFDANLI